MCINKHGDKYTCCCMFPLICGVIIIFMVCLLDLSVAITYGDIFGIVVYSILSIWFVTTFIRKHCHKTRVYLYQSYMISFVIMLIYLGWYIFFSG